MVAWPSFHGITAYTAQHQRLSFVPIVPYKKHLTPFLDYVIDKNIHEISNVIGNTNNNSLLFESPLRTSTTSVFFGVNEFKFDWCRYFHLNKVFKMISHSVGFAILIRNPLSPYREKSFHTLLESRILHVWKSINLYCHLHRF